MVRCLNHHVTLYTGVLLDDCIKMNTLTLDARSTDVFLGNNPVILKIMFLLHLSIFMSAEEIFPT